MATIIDGLQGTRRAPIAADHVLATAKHYAGDGDTEYDEAIAAANVGKPWFEQRYPIDQGVTVATHDEFAAIDLDAVPLGDPSLRGAQRDAVVLQRGLGRGRASAIRSRCTPTKSSSPTCSRGSSAFDGFVISDWEGIHQIPDPDNPGVGGLTPYKVRVGVNAGIDMFMEPNSARSSWTCCWPRSRQVASARTASTTRSGASCRRSSSSDCSSTRSRRRDNLDRGRQRRAPCAGQGGCGRVAGAPEERRRRAAARRRRRHLCRRPQRRQHRQPSRRLDDPVAGSVRRHHPGHHDPRRDRGGGAGGGDHVQR